MFVYVIDLREQIEFKIRIGDIFGYKNVTGPHYLLDVMGLSDTNCKKINKNKLKK
jgi:hypothetical protein